MVEPEKPARTRPLVAAVHRRDGLGDVLEAEHWAPPPPPAEGDPVVLADPDPAAADPATSAGDAGTDGDPVLAAARRASAPLGPDERGGRGRRGPRSLRNPRSSRTPDADPSGAPPSASSSTPTSSVVDRLRDAPVRQLLEGLALCLVGLGLLLGWVVHVPWTGLVDVGLVGLGILLVVQARAGSASRPLIALGVVLALVSLGTWRAGTTLEGGLGRRTVAPGRSALRSYDYRLGTGQLTIDLRRAALAGGPVRVDAEVGIGRIVVRVPKGVLVQTHSVAGAGTTRVFDTRKIGPGVEGTDQTAGVPQRSIVLDLRVGIGSVEVRRG